MIKIVHKKLRQSWVESKYYSATQLHHCIGNWKHYTYVHTYAANVFHLLIIVTPAPTQQFGTGSMSASGLLQFMKSKCGSEMVVSDCTRNHSCPHLLLTKVHSSGQTEIGRKFSPASTGSGMVTHGM